MPSSESHRDDPFHVEELATAVGDKVIRTSPPDEAAHRKAVHEETLRQRAPEQIERIEAQREQLVQSLKQFSEEVLMRFEEGEDLKWAVHYALSAFGDDYRLDHEDF